MPDEPFISSDPNAYLTPYWAELHRRSAFFQDFAPELQANALADALQEDHPARAAAIREWNSTTRRAMIAALDMALTAGPARRETELWRMRKGAREVRCGHSLLVCASRWQTALHATCWCSISPSTPYQTPL